MKKTFLSLVGATLFVASTVPFAAAAEHHKARKLSRAPTPISESIRNSNAYDEARPAPWAQPDWSSRYENGALSAPAGH